MHYTTHTIRHPTPGIGRWHHSENPAGPPVRGREEAAGGRRHGDAERGRFLGVCEARLAVSCAHFFPAVSQSIDRSSPSCLHADGVSLASGLVTPILFCLIAWSCLKTWYELRNMW